MHHFHWNPGDYARRTLGLTPMQDLAYRRLIDRYMLDEKPFPGTAEDVAESIGMFDHDDPDAPNELRAVKAVLRKFFDWRDGVWHHGHCDEAIADFNKHHEQSSRGGVTSGAVRRKAAEARRLAALGRPTKAEPPLEVVGVSPTKIEPTLKHPLPNTHNPINPPIADAMAPPAPDRPREVPAAPAPESFDLTGEKPVKARKGAPAPKGSGKAEKPVKQPETGSGEGKTLMGKDWTPPSWVPPKEWRDFVEHRLAFKQVPFTQAAAELTVRNLDACRQAGHEPGPRLEEAVMRGWRTVFPPDVKPASSLAKNGRGTQADKAADFFAPLDRGQHERKQPTRAARDVVDVEARPARPAEASDVDSDG